MDDPAGRHPASLPIADACLEQAGDVSTSKEGADLATVASAHALVVMARHLDHQNHLLASLARTIEGIERHLGLIAQKVTGDSTPIPPGAKRTMTPSDIEHDRWP